jgi:hypothetical protein
MAKTVIDLANLMDVLAQPSPIRKEESYFSALPGDFKTLRIGALKPEDWYLDAKWQLPDPRATAQIVWAHLDISGINLISIQIRDTYVAYNQLKRLAKTFQFVNLISPSELFIDGSHSVYKLLGTSPILKPAIVADIRRCTL